MKKLILFVVLLSMVSTISYAKKKKTKKEKKVEVYQFTDIKTIPITSVKDQASSGTCWSFATIAMVEADVLKYNEMNVDLSEMWIVRHTYFEKVLKYVRLHGKINLSAGGNAHDVPNMIEKYGIVPECKYSGLNYGTDAHNHGEIDKTISAYANAIVSNPNKKLSTSWIAGLNGILDAYFGVRPESFTIDGKQYTPKEYALHLGINPSDYVSYTSFNHHPFGAPFIVEIPDNWAWGASINVPLDEFMKITEQVVNSGYTISWGSDVSDRGFKYNNGYAVLPETELTKMVGTDQAKWTKESVKNIFDFKTIAPEMKVTQEYRQECFDNYVMTDDHGMLIYGTAVDQNGNKYFKVKNSWGTSNPMKGHFYTSYPFYAGRTINIMFNKKALNSGN